MAVNRENETETNGQGQDGAEVDGKDKQGKTFIRYASADIYNYYVTRRK